MYDQPMQPPTLGPTQPVQWPPHAPEQPVPDEHGPAVPDEAQPAEPVLAVRVASVGHWLRDTGLGITGFVLVLIVALAGWTASFIGLHDFGVKHMGLEDDTAWLVPITFDGAAAGLSLVVFRASINGRGANTWRFLIVVFTALSAWVNYKHIDDDTGRWIASFMPPAAVILFEGLMSEARAAASRRLGRERPRLHPLRWAIDRSGTWAVYRAYVLGIALPDHLQAATDTLPEPLRESPSERSEESPESAPQSATNKTAERSESAIQSATEDAPERPAKAPRKAPRASTSKRPKVSKRSAAKSVIRALYDELGRRPLESEMVAALAKAKAAHTSRQFANTIRREIEKDEPDLVALGSDNVRALTGS